MILGTSTFLILLIALIIDRIVGDPDWLWKHIAHPVVLFGNAISWAEKRFNRSSFSDQKREKFGFLAISFLMILSICLGWFLTHMILKIGWFGVALEAIIVAVFLAQKSLADHVQRVANGLRDGGVEGGRVAVSMIVGRNPDTLDNAGVCRSAIESLAENASDGVVAPAFWYLFFGLPGLFAYKMLNTADSMIGHMNDQYRAFGRASAVFDDFANWLPARLTGIFIVLSGAQVNYKRNLRLMFKEAKLHRSPNAGWPESAMAGVLNISLGGPRTYANATIDEPYLNAGGRKDVDITDIESAIIVFYRAMSIWLFVIGCCAVTSLLFS